MTSSRLVPALVARIGLVVLRAQEMFRPKEKAEHDGRREHQQSNPIMRRHACASACPTNALTACGVARCFHGLPDRIAFAMALRISFGRCAQRLYRSRLTSGGSSFRAAIAAARLSAVCRIRSFFGLDA